MKSLGFINNERGRYCRKDIETAFHVLCGCPVFTNTRRKRRTVIEAQLISNVAIVLKIEFGEDLKSIFIGEEAGIFENILEIGNSTIQKIRANMLITFTSWII